MPRSPEEYRDTEDLDYEENPSPRVEALLSQFQEKLEQAMEDKAYFDPDHRDEVDPSLQRGAILNSLHNAKMLVDDLNFASREERREFAGFAAANIMEKLHSWQEPNAAGHPAGSGLADQSKMIVTDALADRLSAYDTGGRHAVDNQTIAAIHFLDKHSHPDYAEAYPGYYTAFTKRENRECMKRRSLETSPEFTPERYRHDSLTGFQQTAAEQAVHAFKTQFPHTASNRQMESWSLDPEKADFSRDHSAQEGIWRDLKLVFDNQDFPSREAAVNAARELAGAIISGLQEAGLAHNPETHPEPANDYLVKQLAEWLSMEREEFTAQGRERFELLHDALAFAEARRSQDPAQFPGFAELEAIRADYGLGAAAQGVLLLTRGNFSQALNRLDMANFDNGSWDEPATDLRFFRNRDHWQPDLTSGYEHGISPVIAEGYAVLLDAVNHQEPQAFEQAVQYQQDLNAALTMFMNREQAFHHQEVINAAHDRRAVQERTERQPAAIY